MTKPELRKLRHLTQLVILALAFAGGVFHIPVGSLSAFGYEDVSAICPLGYVETLLASKTLVVRGAVGLGIAVTLIVLFGRAFCAWICPVPLIRDGVLPAGRPEKKAVAETPVHDDGLGLAREKINGSDDKDSNIRYYVLGGALASSALFGFPVFCLICPIGLTFAILLSVARIFRFGDVSISLVVFPVIVILELVVFRRWCNKICPVGAIFGLFSRLNRIFRPQVDPKRCLKLSREQHCLACRRACPENITLHDPQESATALALCTKCGDCAAVCPAKAIHFLPWRAK